MSQITTEVLPLPKVEAEPHKSHPPLHHPVQHSPGFFIVVCPQHYGVNYLSQSGDIFQLVPDFCILALLPDVVCEAKVLVRPLVTSGRALW